MQLLIERSSDIYSLALSEAASYGYADVVRLLIANVGVNARNRNGQSLLHMVAAHRGTVELARLLVEAGVCLDFQDAEGDTARHLVAKQGDADVARLPMNAGADPKIRNANGFTSLRLAEHLGRIVIARVLRGQ